MRQINVTRFLVIWLSCLSVAFAISPKKLPENAKTENVLDFLGKGRQSVSTETHLLKDLSQLNLIWEFEKGESYTSPVIKEEKLIYAHSKDDRLMVECLNSVTGKSIWHYEHALAYRDSYGYGNGPRGSAIIDEGRVYLHDVAGTLLCLSLEDGKKIWSINTNEKYDVPQAFFGVTSTPLMEGDLIIVNVGSPGGPCVVAFDKLTSKEVWKAGQQWQASYASPVAATFHGKRRVLVYAGGKTRPPVGGLMCINPENGEIDFEFPWRSETFESVNASTPIVFGNKIYISATYETGGCLLEIQSDFSYKKLWESQDLNCHWNTPIHQNGYIYGVHGRHPRTASLVCLDATVGKKVWEDRILWSEKIPGYDREVNFRLQLGSLLKVDGNYLCLSEMGHLMWMRLNPAGVEVLSRKRLFTAKQTWCAPVVSNGLLYVSQNEKDRISGAMPRLKCYDIRGK